MHRGGGGLIVWRGMLLGESKSTIKFDYVALIIKYLKKSRVGGFKRTYMGIHI